MLTDAKWSKAGLLMGGDLLLTICGRFFLGTTTLIGTSLFS
jgi:hypothetical protein